MFGLFKSWNEKCLIAAKKLYGKNNKDVEEMTASDLSKATAMAKECMKSDYKNCGY